MKILSFLILSSLRTSNLIRSNKIHHNLLINHRFLIKSHLSTSSKKIILVDTLKNYLTNEEQTIIEKHLTECDTSQNDWKHNLLIKMLQVHFQKEETFGDLEQDKIELLQSDYQKLKDKRLAVPKHMTTEAINDLSKLWTDDKSRFHMVAFFGIKQLKRFKYLCHKQIKQSFDVKTGILNHELF